MDWVSFIIFVGFTLVVGFTGIVLTRTIDGSPMDWMCVGITLGIGYMMLLRYMNHRRNEW